MRRAGRIAGGAALLAGLAIAPGLRAQDACVEAAGPPPSLAGYATLFRQAGVAFLARVEDAPPLAVLALVNESASSLTVEFGTFLQVGGDSLPPAEVPVGRRCVRLAAGQAAALAPVPSPGPPIRAVRIRNLAISTSTSGPAPRRDPPQSASPAPPEPPSRPSARPQAPAGSRQFACAAASDPAARGACTAAFLAASARAAALSGAFAGTTRACLGEYADHQERAAALLRAGDPAGDALRDRVPPCFSRDSARWDFTLLERLCPSGVWSGANQGVVQCETAGLTPARSSVAGPETGAIEAPAADSTPPRAAAPEPRREPEPLPPPGAASERRPIDLQTILRLLFGTVLSMAGLGLLIPLLQAALLLGVVAPLALLRRALRGTVPK